MVSYDFNDAETQRNFDVIPDGTIATVRDGSVCERPGYDPASGLLYKPDGRSFPPVSPRPSKPDATVALQTIGRLIDRFPFVSDADRSVALSAILTALHRHAMVTAPLHGFTSPAAGTGKSLLVDVAAILATGRLTPVISQGCSEEELEKRLGRSPAGRRRRRLNRQLRARAAERLPLSGADPAEAQHPR